MRTTIATVEALAAALYIGAQRSMGAKKIEPFRELGADGRAVYRAEAKAALRFMAPRIAKAERRAFIRGGMSVGKGDMA